MSTATNPLLEHDPLAHFSKVDATHVEPAITQLISGYQTQLDSVLGQDGTFTWETLVNPLDEAEDKLEKAWSMVCHLNSVANSDDLRQAYEASQEKLSAFYSALGQNTALFDAYTSLNRDDYKGTLNQAQKQAIENALRQFTLSGVALEADNKKRFSDITQQLSKLTTQFANNVLDATQGWFYHTDNEADLEGIPELAKQAAANAAQQKDKSGFVFTLDIPSYLAVVTHATNRELRKTIYRAYATRASQESDLTQEKRDALDNSPIIDKILVLRQEKAALLGFKSYAELSIAPKMADTTQQVIDFLTDLAQKAKPQAEKEKAELEAFAKQRDNIDALEAWDNAFYSEKLKEQRFNVSQETVREYFPLDVVMNGMFELVEGMFNVKISPSNSLPIYHEHAQTFDITRDNALIAQFYFDCFARDKKRGGAWMADARGKKIIQGKKQTPVAFLTCNFSAPVGDTPSLLTHNDVTTLFHEFGHGLHHMLTQIEVPAVSGISGVAWDAVELPSQFMENFCWEKSILPRISKHYKTGEPLPNDLLENMLKGKNFQSAMQMLRQIEFSLFDFTLHCESHLPSFKNVQACLDTIREQVSVSTPPSFNQFQNSFSHIFAGGYAAGYYSYKWAEVLSADAFEAFIEEGIENKETGTRFLSCILEMGGSYDAMTLFKRFRGREPSITPLLKHCDIKAA